MAPFCQNMYLRSCEMAPEPFHRFEITTAFRIPPSDLRRLDTSQAGEAAEEADCPEETNKLENSPYSTSARAA